MGRLHGFAAAALVVALRRSSDVTFDSMIDELNAQRFAVGIEGETQADIINRASMAAGAAAMRDRVDGVKPPPHRQMSHHSLKSPRQAHSAKHRKTGKKQR